MNAIKDWLPFIPIYLAFVPLFRYVLKHERERVKDELLLRQICRKLDTLIS